MTNQRGKTSIRSAFAPTPLAIATRPVRTHAAYVRSAANMVRIGGEFSPPVGAVLDTRRTALHVGGTILYAVGAVLELIAVLDDLWFCGHAL